MKFKILFFLLFAPVLSLAQEFSYNGIKYTVISGTEKTCQTKPGFFLINPGNTITGKLELTEKVIYNDEIFTLTEIGAASFKNNVDITGELIIPNSVISINSNAFSGCSGVTGSLTIPESVTSIGPQAFQNCSGFNGSLTIGKNVQSIGSSAFYGCSGFTGSLIIPSKVQTIGKSAFEDCSGFTGSLTIPDGVTSIGESAFEGCSGFNGVLTIPDGVTSIGESAFYHCSGFTGALTIPDGVTSIGDYAFNGCRGFTGSLTIPESVTSIGKSAFAFCSGFNGNLTIPDGVTSIGENAFIWCSRFTGSLTIPESITSIGISAFEECSGFNGDLTIPDGVTSIGERAFYGCSGFTGSLTIPDGVTSIGSYAFAFCSGFNGSLTIGNSVETIDSWAFNGCSGFNAVMTSLNPTPPVCESLPPAVKTVYVPKGSKEAYQQADYWKNYTILELPGELEGTLQIEDFSINAGETKDVTVSFTGDLNGNTYSGFQFNLSMPQGLTLTDASLSDQLASAGFNLRTPTTGENKILIISANTSGKTSEITDGLVTITVAAAPDAPHGQSQISLTGASFSSLLGSDLTLNDSETTVTINNIPVTGFIITPDEELNINVGQECTLSAEVSPQNATNKEFTWSIENEDEGFVTVEKKDKGEISVKGVKLGTAILKITASDFQGFSTTVNVNVVPTPAESVEISDKDLILLEGTTWQLTATVYPEETTYNTITWTSENEDIATVTQDGLVTAVKAGEITVTATCGDVSGECSVIVKSVENVSMTPETGSIEGDEDLNPGENTKDGMAVMGKDLIIRVGQEGSVMLKVTPGVNYDPDLQWELSAGGESFVQMTVDSDNSLSATFKGLTVGKTMYTVSTPANNTPLLSGHITVIAENPVMSLTLASESISLPKNALPYQLTAETTPETGTTYALNWESSLKSIATVDAEGKVTPVAEGECDITVTTTDGTDLSAVCHVTVTAPIDDNFEFDFDESVMGDAEGITIYLGDSYKLVPKAKDGYVLPDNIIWSSSDQQTVSVEEDGTIHGLLIGDATVTAKANVNNREVTATCNVKVIPIPPITLTISGGDVESIKCKETLTLTAIVLPENTTYPEVTWETSSADNATVSPEGVVTGVKAGSVTITAYVTLYPEVRDTYELEITDLLLGDSNDNGLVNVADVVTTANYIINMPVASWSFINADVTHDKDITIADVTGTVDIILNDVPDVNARLAMKAKASKLSEDLLVSGNFRNGEPEARIDVKLESSVPYSALQSSIILPEGMEVNDILAGSRLSDHILMFNAPKEGIVKVVIFSLYNTEFNKTDEPLFTIIADTGNASGDLHMLDIFGSDSESNESELGFSGGINESYTTGMETLNSDKVIVRGMAGGIEVINADGRTVSVFRHTGEIVASIPYASSLEKINLLPGIYIVKAGAFASKVIVK